MWYIVPNMKTRLLTCLCTLLLLEAVASCSRGFSHEGICYAYCGAGVSVQKSETMEHAGNLMIPDTVAHQNERYAVVKIEQDAFKDCKSLRSVVIPHTIKEIGSRAFEGCQGLKAIHCQVAVPLVIDETCLQALTSGAACCMCPCCHLLPIAATRCGAASSLPRRARWGQR